MLPPVQFDDELALFAEEIEDVSAERYLATKFQSLKPAIPQSQPQSLLRLGRITPQAAGPNGPAGSDRTEAAQ
jgi:hypothetical protein